MGKSSFIIYKTAFNYRGIKQLSWSVVLLSGFKFRTLFKCLFEDANTNLKNMNGRLFTYLSKDNLVMCLYIIFIDSLRAVIKPCWLKQEERLRTGWKSSSRVSWWRIQITLVETFDLPVDFRKATVSSSINYIYILYWKTAKESFSIGKLKNSLLKQSLS